MSRMVKKSSRPKKRPGASKRSHPQARKSLGQHFLMHAQTASRIVAAADLSPAATVLEVGPGTGVLTRELLKAAKKVIAVEADGELAEKLRESFAEDIASGKLELVHRDIRAFDLSSVPAGYSVVANIPYYLSGELFRKFLEAENQPSSMTLLVQKEVAERIAREKKGNLLALSVKAYGTPRYAFTVPRGAFVPAPKVDSAVLVISDISRERFASRAEEARYFKLLHAGFAHKRKFLAKNLAETGFDASAVLPKARAEDLPFDAWIALAREG